MESLGISFGYRYHENITETLTDPQNGQVQELQDHRTLGGDPW